MNKFSHEEISYIPHQIKAYSTLMNLASSEFEVPYFLQKVFSEPLRFDALATLHKVAYTLRDESCNM